MSIATELQRIQTAITSAFTAVSSKGGTVPTSKTVSNLKTAIDSIPSGLDTSDATATASDILSGKTAYSKGSKITGSMSSVTAATPSISVSSSGLITASTSQSAGYVSAANKSATKQLTTQAAQTITPGTSNKTIASGRYLTGTQTIQGDSNLVAGNIKKGITIFGVNGSLDINSPSKTVITNCRYRTFVFNTNFECINSNPTSDWASVGPHGLDPDRFWFDMYEITHADASASGWSYDRLTVYVDNQERENLIKYGDRGIQAFVLDLVSGNDSDNGTIVCNNAKSMLVSYTENPSGTPKFRRWLYLIIPTHADMFIITLQS